MYIRAGFRPLLSQVYIYGPVCRIASPTPPSPSTGITITTNISLTITGQYYRNYYYD